MNSCQRSPRAVHVALALIRELPEGLVRAVLRHASRADGTVRVARAARLAAVPAFTPGGTPRRCHRSRGTGLSAVHSAPTPTIRRPSASAPAAATRHREQRKRKSPSCRNSTVLRWASAVSFWGTGVMPPWSAPFSDLGCRLACQVRWRSAAFEGFSGPGCACVRRDPKGTGGRDDTRSLANRRTY